MYNVCRKVYSKNLKIRPSCIRRYRLRNTCIFFAGVICSCLLLWILSFLISQLNLADDYLEAKNGTYLTSSTLSIEYKYNKYETLQGYKIILFGSWWYGREWAVPSGGEHFAQCPIKQCFIYSHHYFNNSLIHSKADAIIYHVRDYPQHKRLRIPNVHPAHQRWVFYLRESPTNTYRDLRNYDHTFNWTMTYRSDSDFIVALYKWVPHNHMSNLRLEDIKPDKNYAAGKHKLIAWFVSNCLTRNKREQFVGRLLEIVPVDIYGLCVKNNRACRRNTETYRNGTECMEEVISKYKFYLAFENSNCREYITEKFWKVGLQMGAIPIVMGAPREDFQRLAPPGSYIHVDDFDNVKDLANYLFKLDKDDMEYSRYFRWKQMGQIVPVANMGWCNLCKALHDPNSPRKSYDYIHQWWNKKHDCQPPHKVVPPKGTYMQFLHDPSKYNSSST